MRDRRGAARTVGRSGADAGPEVGHVTVDGEGIAPYLDGEGIAPYLPGKEIQCSTPTSSAVG
ncbi:hypothetical protein SAM23877_1014 [Streptomyces ambofaciens ATCC 23877]|uniref:Uncharacterized protein n=1 Tax=Streptomyces ambofaciens (strain ATCC 23877 / 3486 / DSM 40053 / JCM 4204 / NBRC 12836 / NRRL B-2516) TaxID=278992 RepID=A0A0K2AM49_STRA7|nr:hypothetical protein SAM23877_1014 [Streptomyces ambofaciens ATCC 23877]